ncbi:hypothetical protein GQ53DRAFT_176527 [Thozetella sp. PMI_491]|nr:hypothetical protein GQ53DRAFT_176527 [Thozetella sp. PMI_491]
MMANAISQWAWRLLGLGQSRGAANPDNLPFLPSPRRPVTPRSSKPSSTFIFPNGLFFGRLPLELRQRILVDLFGDRPVHLDLHFAPPRPPGQRIRHFDFGLDGDDNGPREFAPPSNEPPVWQWRSCICHRNHPASWDSEYYSALWTDQCLEGRAFVCMDWPGEAPEKCHIHVMDWLLVCRQAYLEGINILYSTNTFVIADSDALARNLTRLLVPRSLALITSLELTWEIARPPGYDAAKPHEWPEPVDLPFSMIKKVFPGLRSLHLSLQGDMISTGEAEINDPATKQIIEVREKVIFEAAEQFLDSMDLRHFYLALNWTLWSQLKEKAGRDASYAFDDHGYPGPRFWRQISSGEERGAEARGIWVAQGRHGW